MKNPFKRINLFFTVVLVLTAFSCSKDDAPAPVEEMENNEITIQDFSATIDENQSNGESLGSVEADSESTLSFSIVSQTPAGALNINTSTGELTIIDATLFDFETNPTITANISATNSGNAETATVTITLNNVNELSVEDLTATIDENPTDGDVVGTIQPDADGVVSFSIASQTPAGALNIDQTTGELTVLDPNLFDFETNPVITADVSVDNSGSTATALVTINLNDVDEITVQDLNASIDENPSTGATIGTLQATAGGSLTYTITFQNPAGALTIDANTGELSVADETLFDFETNPDMLATISVDNGTSSVSANALVSTNNVNEIGDFKYGGVIFWLDPSTNNSSGLVCAVSDQSNNIGASWGSNAPTIGNVATAIGTGQANTNAILAVHTQGTNAAKLCNSYTANGFSDWYLPSKP